MAELLKVFKAITDKSGASWQSISDVDKIECFFIINRYFSKTYPEKTQAVNDKEVDKIAVMDLWHHYMRKQPYPSNFWSKAPTTPPKLGKGEYSESDINLLIEKLEIKPDEFRLLHANYKDLLDEELKYYKNLQKQ